MNEHKCEGERKRERGGVVVVVCVGGGVGERSLGVGVFKNCTNSLYKLNSNLIFIYKHSRIARVFTADASDIF